MNDRAPHGVMMRDEVPIIQRRAILQRDPPVIWQKVITDIRAAGYSTAQICFILNVPRGTFWHWESSGVQPPFEEGRALLKLREYVTTAAVVENKK